ncbi:MAG: hypothetical protein LUG91_07020 [Ruminococcus sp.]|nr:hypothetical protein [Ruminococcus sp.]
MSVFKMVLCDIKEGTLKNKRFIAAPLVALFVLLVAQMRIDSFLSAFSIDVTPTLFNLLIDAFRGCDPLSKIMEMHASLPYIWTSIFIFSTFTIYDYAYDDISNFGMQIILRTGRRSSWWHSKCIWVILSGVYYYALFLLTLIVFAAANGYSMTFKDNTLLSDLLANSSCYYTFKNTEEVKGIELLIFILSPLIVICTLNIFQMTLSLFIKPLYSFFVTLGVLLLTDFVDWTVIFPRSAMMTFSEHYQQGGYDINSGWIVCIVVIAVSVITGGIWFRRYDILPQKNEV